MAVARINQEDAIVSTTEIADRLGVSQATVYNYLHADPPIIPSRKVGRRFLVIRGEFENWLAGRSAAAEDSARNIAPSDLVALLGRLGASGKVTLKVTIELDEPASAPIVRLRR